MVLSDLLRGRPRTVFYIPSSGELMEAVRASQADAPPPSVSPIEYASSESNFALELVDALVKEIVKKPTLCSKLDQVDLC